MKKVKLNNITIIIIFIVISILLSLNIYYSIELKPNTITTIQELVTFIKYENMLITAGILLLLAKNQTKGI